VSYHAVTHFSSGAKKAEAFLKNSPESGRFGLKDIAQGLGPDAFFSIKAVNQRTASGR
jgi:hypothetical protein